MPADLVRTCLADLAAADGVIRAARAGTPSHDRDNPIDADLIVVDEARMLDLILANKLIKAIPAGAHLLLVGDVDQLPSVGAGEVLRDRSVGGGVNAHRINAGQPPVFGEHPDFFLFPADEPEATASGLST